MSHLFSTHPRLFEPGDRMSREEFLTRWEQMPDLNNAELIDGVVYMPSHVHIAHGELDGQAHFLLGFFAAHTPGTKFAPNTSWLMLESAPQPDASLYILPEYGGQMCIRNKYATGAPELVFEISASSRSYDLGPKLALYQRAQVQEYIAALLEERRIEYRVLENGRHRLIPPDSDHVYRSQIFPGLWIDEPAFWNEDTVTLRQTIERGVASPEHQRLIEALLTRRASSES